MSKIKYNEHLSYEIFDDGYDIYKDDVINLTQREPYAHVFKPEGTYEENALLHLESIEYSMTHDTPSPEELIRADIDFIALVEGLDLPSQDVAPEEEGE